MRRARGSVREAASQPMTTMTAADAGLDAGTLGLEHATTKVTEAATRPPRSGGEIVKNEGDGGVKIAEFLASQKLI